MNSEMSMCPFCPITLPGSTLGDMHGEVESGYAIAGIGACGWCVEFAGIGDTPGNVQFLLQKLAAPIAPFFESLALVATLYPERQPELIEVSSHAT